MDEVDEVRRWIVIYHWGFGYTKCPYCGDETGWYNPINNKLQSDIENNRRTHCPTCKKRVYAREWWTFNQPLDMRGGADDQ